MNQTGHVAILAAPGMGHLIPLVEFAERLIQLEHPKLSVTLIIPTSGELSRAQNLFLQALPNGISYTVLPPVNLDDLQSDNVRTETRIVLTIVRSLPFIRSTIRSLVATTRLVSLVADTFGVDAFDVAREFDVPAYFYFGSGAMCLSFAFCLPELDEKVSCEYRDMHEPVQIPGSVSLHGKDFFGTLQDRKNDVYKWILHLTKKSLSADGILVNTFKNLETKTIEALQTPDKPPIYPIGPLVQISSSSSSSLKTDHQTADSDCLKWLDDQPLGSVLYVSFGSGGTISRDQMNELAEGLEISERRFLWVVRCPNDVNNSADYLDSKNSTNPFDFLPKGFLQRIKGRGFVVPNWAPQAQILSHGSTGGFLTHCGWSSTLESLVNGVPLIAWPLFAEQNMNAILLNEVLEVALRPKTSKNGLIERVEIAKVVKSLVEGEEGKQLRIRMRGLKDAAKQDMSPDGYSTKALLEVASKWIH